MRAFEYRHRVLFEDTSAAGSAYFTRFLSWQGRCRELFLLEHAPQVIECLGDRLALVTAHCSCEYMDEVHVGEEVLVRMRLARLAGHLIDLDFDYWRVGTEGDALVARGQQQIACVRRESNTLVPEPVPGSLVDALEGYRAKPVL